MLKKSLQNILSSIIGAVISLVILIYTSNKLGAEGRGIYTYFITTLALVQLAISIMGNSIMVYMMNKQGSKPILILSTLWAIGISVVSAFVIISIDDFYYNHFWLLFWLNLFQAIFQNICTYLAYLSDFTKLSIIKIIQPLIVLLFLFSTHLNSPIQFLNYVWMSYFPFVLYFLYVFYSVLKTEKLKNSLWESFKSYFSLGLLAQATNLMQFTSYRFTVWLLVIYVSFSEIGVFGLWLSFYEMLLIIAVNVAQVNYSYVAAGKKSMNLRKISLLNFLFIVIACAVFFIIPTHYYELILGKDFNSLKNLMLISAIGIGCLSIAKIYASYFSAKGFIKYNTVASAIGFLVILSISFPLVKNYGLKGAVISNSLSYIATTAVTLFIYRYIYKPNQLNEETN